MKITTIICSSMSARTWPTRSSIEIWNRCCSEQKIRVCVRLYWCIRVLCAMLFVVGHVLVSCCRPTFEIPRRLSTRYPLTCHPRCSTQCHLPKRVCRFSGVQKIIVPCTSLKISKEGLRLALIYPGTLYSTAGTLIGFILVPILYYVFLCK